MRAEKLVAPPLLTTLVAASVLAGASFGYELSAGAHRGASQPTSALAIPADLLGLGLAVLLCAQLFAGYRLYRGTPLVQLATHRVLAYGVTAVVAAHGVIAGYHSLQPPREPSPIWLAAMGVALAAGVGAQFVTGLGTHKAAGTRSLHRVLGTALVALTVLHVALGTWHAITG